MIRNRVSDAKRLSDILRTVVRKEAGYILERAGVTHLLPFSERMKVKRHEEPGPETLRETLEELGPTFIKLGQMFANRPDVTPQRYVEELEKLEYAVEPIEWEDVREVVEQEIGLDSFEDVNEEPLATASIAQVHEATLESGEDVVLKVRKPGIKEQISEDLEILKFLSSEASDHISLARELRVKEIVEQFCSWTEEELDFKRELKNGKTFAETLPDEADARTPEFYEEYSTEAVLTMEKVDGVRCTQTEKLQEMDVTVEHIKDTLIHVGLKQTIRHGFFHGDPHPSNFLIEESGTVVYIDFGIIGTASKKNRESMGLLLIHLVNEDVEAATDIVEKISRKEQGAERGELEELVTEKTLKLKNMSLDMGSVTRELVDMAIKATRMGYVLPNSIVLIGKDLMTVEGIAMKISPETEINEDMKEYALEALKESNRPQDLAETAALDLLQNKDLITKLPSKINDNLEESSVDVHNHVEENFNLERPAMILAVSLLGLGGALIAENLYPVLLAFLALVIMLYRH